MQEERMERGKIYSSNVYSERGRRERGEGRRGSKKEGGIKNILLKRLSEMFRIHNIPIRNLRIFPGSDPLLVRAHVIFFVRGFDIPFDHVVLATDTGSKGRPLLTERVREGEGGRGKEKRGGRREKGEYLSVDKFWVIQIHTGRKRKRRRERKKRRKRTEGKRRKPTSPKIVGVLSFKITEGYRQSEPFRRIVIQNNGKNVMEEGGEDTCQSENFGRVVVKMSDHLVGLVDFFGRVLVSPLPFVVEGLRRN
jgi:hypothetical protein